MQLEERTGRSGSLTEQMSPSADAVGDGSSEEILCVPRVWVPEFVFARPAHHVGLRRGVGTSIWARHQGPTAQWTLRGILYAEAVATKKGHTIAGTVKSNEV